MSFRWPNKDPDEQLDYSIDWSRFLGSATISSVVWSVNNASGVKTTIGGGATVMVYRMYRKHKVVMVKLQQ